MMFMGEKLVSKELDRSDSYRFAQMLGFVRCLKFLTKQMIEINDKDFIMRNPIYGVANEVITNPAIQPHC